MENIKNDAELAKEIAQNIKNLSSQLFLTEINFAACEGLYVEEQCLNSYKNGKDFVVKLQSHVLNATDYIEQISETLQQADRTVMWSWYGDIGLTK